MWRFVLEVALAISVGVNVYLMTRHEAPSAPTLVKVAEPRACPPAPDAAVVVVAPPVDASTPVCPPAAKADCSAVEKQLAETEAKLEAHLPPAERYKHAPRAMDVEARARELLDPIFAGLSKSPHAYDVQCHGSVCKVSSEDPSVPIETWTHEVQQHGGFERWEFTGGDAYAVIGAETAR